jgi:hypothetical protein
VLAARPVIEQECPLVVQPEPAFVTRYSSTGDPPWFEGVLQPMVADVCPMLLAPTLVGWPGALGWTTEIIVSPTAPALSCAITANDRAAGNPTVTTPLGLMCSLDVAPWRLHVIGKDRLSLRVAVICNEAPGLMEAFCGDTVRVTFGGEDVEKPGYVNVVSVNSMDLCIDRKFTSSPTAIAIDGTSVKYGRARKFTFAVNEAVA